MVLRLECVEQRRDHPVVGCAMDEEIAPFVVAEPPVQPVFGRIEHEDFISIRLPELERTCQPELERHVEARWRSDSTHVMQRDSARLHQLEDALQTSFTCFADFEYATRLVFKESDHADERDEQRLVHAIERRVDENLRRIDGRRFAHFARAVLGEERCAVFRLRGRGARAAATARATAACSSGVNGYAALISDAVSGFPMYWIFGGFRLGAMTKEYLGYPPRYAFLIRSDANSAFVVSCSTIRPVSIT